ADIKACPAAGRRRARPAHIVVDSAGARPHRSIHLAVVLLPERVEQALLPDLRIGKIELVTHPENDGAVAHFSCAELGDLRGRIPLSRALHDTEATWIHVDPFVDAQLHSGLLRSAGEGEADCSEACSGSGDEHRLTC